MPHTTRKGTSIAHVGIALRATEDLIPFYRDILELPEFAMGDSDGAKITGFAAGDSLVELLEPDSPDTPIGKFIEKRGPGLHHICFAVDDLEGTLAKCKAAGIRLIDETPRLGAEGKRIAFLHPASTGGTLVELSEY